MQIKIYGKGGLEGVHLSARGKGIVWFQGAKKYQGWADNRRITTPRRPWRVVHQHLVS